jgi:NitT/TauT family transport system permease protein/putative hydroxymethylpyrimidine transport system permease protein
MHLWVPARRALHPLVVGSQALPIPVLAAPLVLLLGFGLAPKVVIIALVCFFPVTVNLYDGLRSVDPEQRKLLRSLHASRWQTLRLLELPAAMPQAFTGLRIGAAVSVIGAVFAEWSGSENGLGHSVLISSGQLESARTFAATVLLFVLAITLYTAFGLAERRLITWAPRADPGGP